MKSLLVFILPLFFYINVHAQGHTVSGNTYNGVGTYQWDDGSKYTGQWVDGKRTGLGVYDWSSGAYYYGYFVDGKLEGKGFYIALKKEDDLVGRFHDGKLSEKVSMATTGCVLGDCQNGVGVWLWESDDIYIGDWTGGIRTGYGRYDWKSGARYIGHFKEAKLDGEGDYLDADGKKMTGSFINGQFQGTATNTKSNDTKSASSYTSNEVQTKDFCTAIKMIVKDYPNNFVSLKGEVNEYLDDEWDSNIEIEGSIYSSVYQDYLYEEYNVWESELYKAATWDEAFKKYKDYINKKDYCDFGCGPLKSEETKDDIKKKYKITWKVGDDNTTYKKMKVEIALEEDYSKQYKITLTVEHQYF